MPDIAVARSTPVAERALAPDLARGFMLLLIVLANSVWYLWPTAGGLALMHPAEGGAVDRVVQAIMITGVDGRAYPMFAFLFAYGIGQLLARQTARGVPIGEVRRLLRTRHLWLIAFGACHALLLWEGDILGRYGLVGLLLVPLFLACRDKTLRIWVFGLLGFGAAAAIFSLLGGVFGPADVPTGGGSSGSSIANPDYLSSALERISSWAQRLIFLGLITLAIPTSFLIGMLAARHRILDEPEQHLRLLRRIAIIGIAVGWVGGAATALNHLGIAGLGPDWAYAAAHLYTGVFGGIGYAALFGLIAQRLARRGQQDRFAVRTFVALGRRSMSGYLAQSVICAPILAAWGLGIGTLLTSWSMALFAVGVWLVTLLGAYALDRAGRRGPAETLLRRLSYGPGRSRSTTP